MMEMGKIRRPRGREVEGWIFNLPYDPRGNDRRAKIQVHRTNGRKICQVVREVPDFYDEIDV